MTYRSFEHLPEPQNVQGVDGPVERRVLFPRDVKFTRGPDQRLYMHTDRGTEGPVNVHWPFPLTDPDGYVIVSHAHTRAFLALLRDYKRLDPDSLRVVQEALEESYFLPRITKIVKIDDDFHVMVWQVETDRGPRTFEVRSRQRDIRWLSDHHVVITDVDGNRYEIEDLRRLDPESRELLEMEV